MRTLRFVGLDDSGTRLLFRSEDEHDYTVEADERLVQAVRRTHGWQGRRDTNSDGQAERQVDTQTSELRPREIQARVRAGESPQQVAESAGVDLERVARFARPVLQEREHVADAAQRVVVRTGALDGPLGEVVTDRLAHVAAAPAPAWDSWRREDGRWTVVLTFHDDASERTARWSYDPTTNSVTVDDETARWLTEGTSNTAPAAPEAASAPSAKTSRAPRARRLLSVPDLEPEVEAEAEVEVESITPATYDENEIADELAALGLQPVTADPSPVVAELAEVEAPILEAVIEERPESDGQTTFDLPVDAPAQPVASAPVTPTRETPAAEALEAEAKPTKKSRKAKRASVPSWDDIVFGARKSTD